MAHVRQTSEGRNGANQIEENDGRDHGSGSVPYPRRAEGPIAPPSQRHEEHHLHIAGNENTIPGVGRPEMSMTQNNHGGAQAHVAQAIKEKIKDLHEHEGRIFLVEEKGGGGKTII